MKTQHRGIIVHRTRYLLAGVVLAVGGTTVLAQPEPAPDQTRERQQYEQIISTVEPGLKGSAERLPAYLAVFQRELINDRRLFPFTVAARAEEGGRIALDGAVGFRENREALVKFLQHLGFEDLIDRVEVLPSSSLGAEQFGLVRVAHAFLYDRPGEPREVLDNYVLGAPVYLLKPAGDEAWLCLGADGYVGYIEAASVRRVGVEPFDRYQSGPQVVMLKNYQSDGLLVRLGARLKWIADEAEGVSVELPSGDLTKIPRDFGVVYEGKPSQRVERVLAAARRLLGTRYVWGGNTSAGIDCSGLAQMSFAAEGINLPRDASQQVYMGRLVATRWHRTGLRPGDTLYFLGARGTVTHTGIYLGDDQYIEAVRPVVRVTSFDPADAEYDAARAAAFAFGKRLLE